MAPPTERRVVIFLSHADAGSFRLAGSCALAAVALGDRVDVFLFNEAIRAVVEGFDDAEHPAHFLYEARRNAESAGKCRLLGCSASLVQEKVSLESANAALDAVIGWPTVLEWSRGVVERFFF